MGAKRPLLVTLIGVIYVLLGLLLLLVSGIVLAATGMAVDPEIEEIAGLSGGAVAVLGIIQIVVGAGFLKGWKLWWYLGVIFTILNLIFGIASLFVTGAGGIVLVIVALIILWYLFRDNVKEFFLD